MISIKYFNCDSPELEYVKNIRKTVFTDEQGAIANCDIDFYDDDKSTVFAVVKLADGIYAGTGRIAFIDNNCCKIGRIAILKQYRGMHLGSLLVCELLKKCNELGAQNVYVDSQLHAVEFYKKYGFVECGSQITDRGLPHMPMKLQ